MARIIMDHIWKCILYHLYPFMLPVYSPGPQVLVFAQHWAWVSIFTGPAVRSVAFQLSFSDAHQTCLFQASLQSERFSCCLQSGAFKQQLLDSHDIKSIFLIYPCRKNWHICFWFYRGLSSHIFLVLKL